MKQNIKAIICGFFQSVVFHCLGLLVIVTIHRYYIENYYIFSLLCSFISAMTFLIFVNKKSNKILIRFILINLTSFFMFTILFFPLIKAIDFSWISSAKLNSGDSFLLMLTLVEFLVYSFFITGIIALILFVKNRSKNKGCKT